MSFWSTLGEVVVEMEAQAYEEELARELALAELRVRSRRYGRPVILSPLVAIRPTLSYEERRAQRAEADVRRIQAEAQQAEARVRRHEAEKAHDAVKAKERATRKIEAAKVQAELAKVMAAKDAAKAKAKATKEAIKAKEKAAKK